MNPTAEQLAAADAIDVKWFEDSEDESGDWTCSKCCQPFSIGDGLDPTPMCDLCAQTVAEMVPTIVWQREGLRSEIHGWKEAVSTIEAQRDASREERDEARALAEEACKRYNATIGTKLTCAFCGEEYADGTRATQDDRLAAHIASCPKHPMRQLEAEVERLKPKAAAWDGLTARLGDLQGIPSTSDPTIHDAIMDQIDRRKKAEAELERVHKAFAEVVSVAQTALGSWFGPDYASMKDRLYAAIALAKNPAASAETSGGGG